MRNWKKILNYLPLAGAAAVGAAVFLSLSGYTPPAFEAAEKPMIDLSYLSLETVVSEKVSEIPSEEPSSSKKSSVRQKQKRGAEETTLTPTVTLPLLSAGAGAAADFVPMGAVAEPSGYRDGTYTGSGMGFNGPVTVSVTVSGGRIAGIAVTGSSDNEPFFTNAKTLLSRIVGAQTTNVDTVSGATYSSRGLILAVRDALGKAGVVEPAVAVPGGESFGNSENPKETAAPETEEKKSDENLKDDEETVIPKKVRGRFPYPDGIYTGYGEGRNGEIAVKVVLKDKTIQRVSETNIEEIEILSHAQEDEAYFAVASGIVDRILEAQTWEVDAITSATFSSTGIREAVRAALAEAEA